MKYIVELTSLEYGTEVFYYPTKREATAAKRLQKKIETMRDGISRTISVRRV